MLMLLITVVLGIIFAVFATQNTTITTIYFGGYSIQQIPIYLVVLVSVLLGLSISLFVYVVRTLSDSMTISEHKGEVKKLKKELADITKEAHKLELENAKLKSEMGKIDEDSI